MSLNRRTILASAALAGPAALLTSVATRALASAPLVGQQAPNFYRAKLGSYEITVVSDGARPMPLPAEFVRNVPNDRVLAEAEASYMPKGSIVAPSTRSWSTRARS